MAVVVGSLVVFVMGYNAVRGGLNDMTAWGVLSYSAMAAAGFLLILRTASNTLWLDGGGLKGHSGWIWCLGELRIEEEWGFYYVAAHSDERWRRVVWVAGSAVDS